MGRELLRSFRTEILPKRGNGRGGLDSGFLEFPSPAPLATRPLSQDFSFKEEEEERMLLRGETFWHRFAIISLLLLFFSAPSPPVLLRQFPAASQSPPSSRDSGSGKEDVALSLSRTRRKIPRVSLSANGSLRGERSRHRNFRICPHINRKREQRWH